MKTQATSRQEHACVCFSATQRKPRISIISFSVGDPPPHPPILVPSLLISKFENPCIFYSISSPSPPQSCVFYSLTPPSVFLTFQPNLSLNFHFPHTPVTLLSLHSRSTRARLWIATFRCVAAPPSSLVFNMHSSEVHKTVYNCLNFPT